MQTAIRRIATVVIVAGMGAGRAVAQNPGMPDTAAVRAAAAYVRGARDAQQVPGVQLAVMRDGRLVWNAAVGMADLEQRVPVTPGTRFRIGSVSKPLTATALAILARSGRLDLDAPVQRYVPGFPTHGATITLRQLAGHLSGLRHYTDAEDLSTRHFGSVDEAVAVFAGDSLLFAPGTRFSYSSYGYVLASAAIERAAGQPFTAAMRRLVFAPAGMSHTTFDYADSVIPGRARPYHRAWDGAAWVGPVSNAPFVDLSNRWAAGGVLSTAGDLARFGDALLRGRLVDGATQEMMWTSQRTAADSATGYGLGFFVAPDAQGRPRVYHGGNATGATAKLVIYPADRVVVAILWNGDFGDFAAGRIAEPFLARRAAAASSR